MALRLRVPVRFSKARLESLDPQQMACVLTYSAALGVNLRKGRGLLLSGKPGIGKSWAVAALTRSYAVTVARPDYEYVTAPEFFDNFGDYDGAVDAYRDRLWADTYCSVPWLVLNDLGKEYRGGKLEQLQAHRLGRVLRARCEKKLTTHVTTNMTGAQLKETYGESIFSLMSEMMSFHVISGQDRRIESK